MRDQGNYALLLVLLLFSLSGCVTKSLPSGAQVPCWEPRTVYIVNHGRHAGLVFEAAALAGAVPDLAENLRSGKYVEIGWGDLRFYQAENPTFFMGVRALFKPTASVLHLAVIGSEPESYFSGQEVYSLQVEQAGYQRMVDFVAGSFVPAGQDEPVMIGPGLYGLSWFYRARGDFHLFNNCNTWVAQALDAAGYPVSLRTVTVSSLFKQLNSASPGLCFPVRTQ